MRIGFIVISLVTLLSSLGPSRAAIMRAAKETVTITYANKTFEYDVTQLPTAEARFLQLCNQTSAH
jgi:hypothetical protein